MTDKRHETRSTCCYCGVGCGVIIEHDGSRISGVRGDPGHPANFGRLCTKGATLHLSARPETRALHPELRLGRDAPRTRVGWDAALDHAADRFAAIIDKHGPDAVAFYISGQLLTEDYYAFNKLAKGLIGTNNVDTNSRLCMSSAVSAYKMTLGADAPPCSYEDIDHTDCLLIAGGNPAYAHPIVYRRIEDARRANPALKLIVIDPRRTDTASDADLHLPLLPGTDVWLFNAMLHVLLWEGHADDAFIRAHTEGFDALRRHVRDVTPAVAAEICGLRAEDIVTAAQWFGSAKAAMSMWCQGLNQSHHGTHNGTALIALHLATGQIGRPGAGPFSLTGQPNAMGGREVGGMANLLSGHRDLANPAHRAEVARLWGIDDVPAQPGLTAVDLFEGVRSGQVKAIWIACTNPAHSMPDQALITEALQTAEFVVVQDACRSTETAAFADLLLPASTWGEKEGTVTNSERRITHVKAALPPPGEARADWRIACDFAHVLAPRLGRDAMSLFPYDSVEQLFNEHAETTRGRDLDITGLSYALLDRLGPQQWPFPAGADAGRARLYTERTFATADGRARFVVPVTSTTAEKIDARFPLHLNTGRLRDQWHCMSRTGQVAQLYSHVDEPRVEVHADDLARRGLADGDLVRIRSRRGDIVLRAHASAAQRPGSAFVAMHWGRNTLSNSGANALTAGRTDPYSKQPELKHAAVQIARADLPHQALLLRTEASDEAAVSAALRRSEALAPVLARFAYAALSLAGRERPVLVLRIAHDAPIPDDWLADIDRICALDDPACLVYRDARRDITKRALIEDGLLTGIRLTGETAAAGWLRDVMTGRQPTTDLRRWLFAPLGTPPVATATRGRIVCNCLDVAEPDIARAIDAGADLLSLQQSLRCGTSCGSCVPELKRMLEARRQAA
ncbi:molybdopterin-dependent oxidoreductase [Methyloversatilis sp. XJ19-13]|uniref:nitrate reductase n=1 Tax=Methyloversatilis sp. XJ19-13 TaxID=2963430 RepID=UPI00211C1EC3|nr:nitrate reductase [Methyloversatilis sp. XJ19-13]MCQ9373486.1 molybdopterin-dependent oxidoreductase [Methyloversatilis sp. XJ19-13]